MRRRLGLCLLLMAFQADAVTLNPNLFRQWQERFREHIDDGFVRKKDLSPLVIVAVDADSGKTHALNEAVATLKKVVPDVLVCEACLNNEWRSGQRLTVRQGAISLQEVENLYQSQNPRPRAALWLSADPKRLSYRIVEIGTGRVLYSELIDADVDWTSRSMRNFTRSRQGERKARGDAISHHQWDLGVYPKQHFAYSFLNQWGENNDHLSGFTVTFFEPAAGLGITYMKALMTAPYPLVGVKLLLNIPAAIGSSAGGEEDEDDDDEDKGQAIVGQLIGKQPFPGNFGGLMAMAFVNTDGAFGVGVSW